MSPVTWQEWIAWAGVIIPLFALAWAAVFYTLSHRRAIQQQEFDRFFGVMDRLGQSEGNISSKMAAAYELRKYPEYREVIIRLCEETPVSGGSGKMLKDELLRTAEAMKRGT